MDRIVEAVPNFSTADPKVIAEISAAIKAVKDVRLLNVEPDADYNRTVVTMVGTPEMIGEAAFQGISKATELIDMTQQKGEHPRMGATDVCPFIPVKGVNDDECVEIAKRLAKRVAEELNVPTYLYGKAAQEEKRFKLSDIRKGEYEGFETKILEEEWKPDYGKAEFNAKSGATTIGVRGFLIAYNVNIEAEEVNIAREIGGLVRESGRWVEENGERTRVPGSLKGIQGMGVTLEKSGRKLTQVSMNVVDFKQFAKVHEAFEEVKKLAEEMGSKVTGSEVVGLIPLQAILEAGRFYAPQEMDEDKLVKIAIDNLGLSDLDHFDPQKKIIELMIREERLVDLSLIRFNDDLASNKPAPGGGSVAALGGSLAAALTTMVSNLTIGKKKYAEVEEQMKPVRDEATAIYKNLLELVDEDTLAFNQVMNAYSTPKDDPNRGAKIQKAMIYAAEVPLLVAKNVFDLMDLTFLVVEKGNKNAITDAGVAALFAEAAIRGALYNVRINLLSIKDDEVKNRMTKVLKRIYDELDEKKKKILDLVEKEING